MYRATQRHLQTRIARTPAGLDVSPWAEQKTYPTCNNMAALNVRNAMCVCAALKERACTPNTGLSASWLRCCNILRWRPINLALLFNIGLHFLGLLLLTVLPTFCFHRLYTPRHRQTTITSASLPQRGVGQATLTNSPLSVIIQTTFRRAEQTSRIYFGGEGQQQFVLCFRAKLGEVKKI